MTILEAIILGIVQGVTEFLPVSSSGHLIIAERILGVKSDSLALGLIMHLATLCAVVFAYRKTLAPLIRHPFSKPVRLLALATIPTVIIVFAFNAIFRSTFDGRYLVYCFLFTAILLMISSRAGRKNKAKKQPEVVGVSGNKQSEVIGVSGGKQFEMVGVSGGKRFKGIGNLSENQTQTVEDLTSKNSRNGKGLTSKNVRNGKDLTSRNRRNGKKSALKKLGWGNGSAARTSEIGYLDAVIIGVTQGFAAFPGVSRSGSTISVSMLLGHSKKASAEFSFIMSIPIIIGSAAVELLGSNSLAGIGFLPLLAGFFAAFISGFVALKFLIRLLEKSGFDGFAIYLMCLSVFLLINDNLLFLF